MSNLKHQFDTTRGEKIADKLLFFGEVVDIEDSFESRTIKVRIPDFDIRVEDADLPPCYPLMPAFFHFVPKIGERVAVVMERLYNADKKVNQEKRYYLAVAISQPQNIYFDPYYYTAASNEDDGWTQRDTPISEIPEARGTYLKKDEVGLVGRDNTDVILKDKEVLIRAGKHDKENVTSFNRKNPAYVQVRYAVANSSNEKQYRTITKIEKIEPTHAIIATYDSNNRLLVKSVRLNDDFVEEIFSGSYNSREEVVEKAREKIREFQELFPKWQLRTNEAELQDFPKLFKNNQRIIKERVEVEEQNAFDKFDGSVLNLVAEKINLLSHFNDKNYNLTDPENMIDGETQTEINTTAHPTIKGDILVEFLNLLKAFIANHVHPYHGMPVDKDVIVNKILNYNLDSLLNKNIRLA